MSDLSIDYLERSNVPGRGKPSVSLAARGLVTVGLHLLEVGELERSCPVMVPTDSFGS